MGKIQSSLCPRLQWVEKTETYLNSHIRHHEIDFINAHNIYKCYMMWKKERFFLHVGIFEKVSLGEGVIRNNTWSISMDWKDFQTIKAAWVKGQSLERSRCLDWWGARLPEMGSTLGDPSRKSQSRLGFEHRVKDSELFPMRNGEHLKIFHPSSHVQMITL